MPTVGLYTLGCKVSQYETEAIAEAFEQHGFSVLPYDAVCDVYVINTCTVTAESDRKSRQIIRRAIKKNPGAVVLVTGCYSQRSPGEVLAIPGVDAVYGSADKLKLADAADELLRGRNGAPLCHVTDIDSEPFERMKITGAPRTRAYVKIEDGCGCRCSYCAIPSARGRVRSKAREDVIAEVEALSAAGTKEIVLTGIETGSYGAEFDTPYGLADLLCELDGRKSCERIRLGSLAPELIDKKFVEKIEGLSILAPHFHLSVQSGSDHVLRAMRRRYSRKTALENLLRLRERIPRVQLTTDLMVGFPGETEEDFQETMSFAREVRFLDLHVFAYSRRKDTPAASFPGQIPEAVKRDRSERLIALGRELCEKELGRVIAEGRPLSCVFETEEDGVYTAHSDSYIEFRVPAGENLHGEIRSVTPVSQKDGVIFGRLADETPQTGTPGGTADTTSDYQRMEI